MDGFYLKISLHFGEKSKHSVAQRGTWGGRGKTQAEEVDFSFQSLLDGHRAHPTGSPSAKIHYVARVGGIQLYLHTEFSLQLTA